MTSYNTVPNERVADAAEVRADLVELPGAQRHPDEAEGLLTIAMIVMIMIAMIITIVITIMMIL